MPNWTIADLYRLDAKYAKEGVHMHQRPFRAARDLLGAQFSIGVGGNPEVQRIMSAYAALMPEARQSWPGAGIGLALSVDRARRLTLPVVFGSPRVEAWQSGGFDTIEEWWQWCRGQQSIALEWDFAFADLYDFSYGLDELESVNGDAVTLWRMAQSNLADLANGLPLTFSVDSVLQPICMVAELALKGTLIWLGEKPGSLKGTGGHDHATLAARMAALKPHRDDATVALVTSKLPHYVQSRYAPSNQTRLEVLRLALGVQFVAASALRRVSNTDVASQLEFGEAPVTRLPFFPTGT